MDATTRRQLVRFVSTGVLATFADFGTYFALLATWLPGQHDAAKGLSFLVGTTVAFILNKYWTFEAAEGSRTQVARFVVLYGVSFLLNVGVNRGMLWAVTGAVPSIEHLPPAHQIEELAAVVAATSCSMVANFFGQKLWVFRDDS